MSVLMLERNDFGGRIIRRLDQKLKVIEGDEYTAADEVKILHWILRCLRELEALREGQKNEPTGAEIRKYATTFDTRSHTARSANPGPSKPAAVPDDGDDDPDYAS